MFMACFSTRLIPRCIVILTSQLSSSHVRLWLHFKSSIQAHSRLFLQSTASTMLSRSRCCLGHLLLETRTAGRRDDVQMYKPWNKMQALVWNMHVSHSG